MRESLKNFIKHDPVLRGVGEVGKAVKGGAKVVGRLSKAIGRVAKVAGKEAKRSGKAVGAAISNEVNPYAAGAKRSEKMLKSQTLMAGRKRDEQRAVDQADAEKAYTKKGWGETAEGKEAFAKHQRLIKNGDASERAFRATRSRKLNETLARMKRADQLKKKWYGK